MDVEQEEMQFLGPVGIFREAYKIIFSWRKLFSKITVSLILPLTFIFLAHIEVSDLLFHRIIDDEYKLEETQIGTSKHDKISDLLSSEWTKFFLFKFVYLAFFIVFSLLSTSAVVYTVACAYTAREVTFKKVLTVVPRVWKRLMVTFLCIFVAMLVYNLILLLTLILWAVTAGQIPAGIFVLVIIVIIYFVGFVYMSLVWQLASVVTILEESYGVQAMKKSRNLIKGKIGVSLVIFFILNVCALIIQIAFEKLVVHGGSPGITSRVVFGIVCFLLLFKLFLFALVIQTVLYFVCKSYHHENIDKSSLSDHLEVYLGEYEPLTGKDVQLENFHV